MSSFTMKKHPRIVASLFATALIGISGTLGVWLRFSSLGQTTGSELGTGFILALSLLIGWSNAASP